MRVPAAGAYAALTLMLLRAAPVAGQDAPSFFRRTAISGYIDTYYAYNFNRPATPCRVVDGIAVFNCLHAFDVARNAFSLNLADLAIEKTPAADSRAGFRVDLNYGSGAALIAAADSARRETPQNVLQAYVSYLVPAGQGLRVDAGKFVTPAGFERIDPGGNWNGSRSLLFALAIPREHVGVRVVYTPTDTVNVVGLFSNGWSDITDNAGGKRAGVSVSIRPVPALSVTETYIGGSETSATGSGWRDLSDTTVIERVTRTLSLAFDGDAGRDRDTLQSWQGAALYLRYQPVEWLAITPRVEGLRDHDGFMTGVSQDLQEATVTLEFRHPQGSALRVEYRVDVADRPYFLKGVSTTVRTQSSVAAYWVFVFDSALRKK